MMTWWGDGKARLWNPPADFLPLVVRKIQQENALGVLVAPYWPAQAWFARLRALKARMHYLHPPREGPGLIEGSRVNSRWSVVVAEVGLETNGLPEFAPQC